MPACCLPAGGSMPQRFAVAAYQLFIGLYSKTCDLINGTSSQIDDAEGASCWMPTCLSGYYNKFVEVLAAGSDCSSDNPVIELLIRIFDIMFTIYLAIISLILYISINIIDVTNSMICNLNIGKAESVATEEAPPEE